jgi:hypothetical protein
MNMDEELHRLVSVGRLGQMNNVKTCIMELNPSGNDYFSNIIADYEEHTPLEMLILVARRKPEPKQIVQAICCSNKVIQVILLDCKLNDDMALRIADAVAHGCESLVALVLPYNSITEIGARYLAAGLTSHATLCTLDLSFNSCGDVGADCLATLIRESPALRTLKLKDNGIGPMGATALASALVQPTAQKSSALLEELDLSHNRMGDAGARAFAHALGTSGCPLRALDLSCSAITYVGSLRLAAALRTNRAVESLRVLAISLRRDEEAALINLERVLQSATL